MPDHFFAIGLPHYPSNGLTKALMATVLGLFRVSLFQANPWATTLDKWPAWHQRVLHVLLFGNETLIARSRFALQRSRARLVRCGAPKKERCQ